MRPAAKRLIPREGIEPLEQRIAPAVFVVTTPLDSGPGSLRDALASANRAPGADTIEFRIDGTGPHVIAVQSTLPAILDPVSIDGYTQPGASPNTLDVGNNAALQVWLEGSDAGAADGLVLAPGSDGSKIAGLVIINFRADGFGGNGILVNSSNNTIEGNWIGTDGRGGFANATAGVNVIGGTKNVIGGLAPAARNVVSGNSTGIAIAKDASGTGIAGNYIGTDPAGTAALGNLVGILVDQSSDNTIGVPGKASGNVVSGHGTGIRILGSGATKNQIENTFIGTDSTGKNAIANTEGISIQGATDTSIGGLATSGQGNLISGNTRIGIIDNGGMRTIVRGNVMGLALD
jgi:hypothetical protein